MATKRKRGDRWEFTVKRKKLLDKPFSMTFDSEAEGVAYCTRLEQQLDAGIIPPELADRNSGLERVATIAQAIRRYELAVPVPDSDRLVLETLAEKIGTDRLDGIDYAWSESWVSGMKRVEVLSPSTIRHYVGALARCLDWHVRRGTLEDNPLRLLPKKYATYNDADKRAVVAKGEFARHDETRNRRLDESEEPRIRAVLAGDMLPGVHFVPDLDHRQALVLVFELALETAMRMREIYTLSREQVDLPKRTIHLNRTKNGGSRQVPLSTIAVAKLTAYFSSLDAPLEPGDLLFPWWSGEYENKELRATSAALSKQFGNVFDAAGCPDLHFHDLRHEATCRLFERTKLPEMMIARITGHSSPKLLMRYLSLRGSDLAQHMW